MKRRELLKRAGQGAAATALASPLVGAVPAAAQEEDGAWDARGRPVDRSFIVSFAAASRLAAPAGVPPAGLTQQIFLSGTGDFTARRIELSGSLTVGVFGGGAAAPVTSGTFEATRLLGFQRATALNPFFPTFGVHLGGVLAFQARFTLAAPLGSAFLGNVFVVGNIFPGGLTTGLPTGVTLDVPGAFRFDPAEDLMAGVLFSFSNLRRR